MSNSNICSIALVKAVLYQILLTLFHFYYLLDCSVSSLLKWLTGSSHVPPLGFPKPLTVEFLHGCSPGCKCRPTASTCDIVLKLPVHINDVAEMKELMSSALNESYGFGLI